ncbi:Oidioi.mRNA.OKI2018_I69.chr1.g2449.t1.cds [Oikopleura dioica]|uniref:Oidioi.mRNA.OKI2018_I69.chr1.g2449.t1.cds n=1 Tax=Oikopleura dioica TaxID=34765 RepID=A0ABN7T0A2_OIKDI|nr:Oidioi.mRNA.OKI2018_I69.chr1.g2449.t1.cds [Oikopleura dioica]
MRNFLLIFGLVQANLEPLFFEMLPGEKPRCFLEEMPGDTLMTAQYHAMLVTPTIGIITDTKVGQSMMVKVTNPDGKTILERTYGSKGRFAFTTQQAGSYMMCLSSDKGAWTQPDTKEKPTQQRLRINISFHIGETRQYYKEVAKNEEVSRLKMETMRLSDQITRIMKEQDYARTREDGFRKISEILNSRVLWWACVQVLLVVVVGVWQVTHMRSFFIKKKIS